MVFLQWLALNGRECINGSTRYADVFFIEDAELDALYAKFLKEHETTTTQT